MNEPNLMLPSERRRDGIAMASRGYADGIAEAAPASESMDYGAAYLRGRAMAKAERGDSMLLLTRVIQCDRCRAGFFGDVGACECQPGPAAMTRGILAFRGPNAVDTGPQFLSDGDASALIAIGFPVFDVDGNDVSCDIHVTQ